MSSSSMDAFSSGLRSLSLKLRSCSASVRCSLQKPWTQESVLYHYLPLIGAANYEALALAVLNPKLVRNFNAKLGLRADMTSLYLCSSVVGLSLYLYSRRHMSGQLLQRRAGLSLYLGTLTVLGSTLLWAILAKSLPWNPLLRTLAALASATGMLRINHAYLQALDSKVH